MTRPPPIDIEKRKPFPASERKAILRRQSTDGIARCDVCDQVIAIVNDDGVWMAQQVYEFDHEHARALGGKTHAENGRALCVPCHRAKTNSDLEIIAKADRMAGRTGQHARKKAREARGDRPLIAQSKKPWGYR